VSRSRHAHESAPPVENLHRRVVKLEAALEDAEAERRELRSAIELLAHLLTKAGQRIAAAEAPRQEAYVPLAAASARCGLSPKTLRRLVSSGAIEGRAVIATGKTRRRWLISCESLSAFLATPARK
jgi:hypothetical protein